MRSIVDFHSRGPSAFIGVHPWFQDFSPLGVGFIVAFSVAHPMARPAPRLC
jgi:hypothetical protein